MMISPSPISEQRFVVLRISKISKNACYDINIKYQLPSRAGLKLHRENFAEFKEGVLGRMESKAKTTAKVLMMEEWVTMM